MATKTAKKSGKHRSVKIWTKYDGAKAKGKFCPRCGSGTFLAEHKDRVTCGKCKYSETHIKKA